MPSKNRPLEEVKAIIQSEFDEWFDYLGLSAIWSIKILYGDPKEFGDDGDEFNAEGNWPAYYRNGTIKFNKKNIVKMDNDELEALVIHELVHFVFADMWDFINAEFGKGAIRDRILQQEEKNVDMVTRIIQRYEHDKNTEDNPTDVELGIDGTDEESDVSSIRRQTIVERQLAECEPSILRTGLYANYADQA